MPLGDSVTEGSLPDKPGITDSYRGHLYNMLIKEGYKVDFVGSQSHQSLAGGDGDHSGYSGFSIGPDDSTNWPEGHLKHLKPNLYENLDIILQPEADIILLMIGFNDIFPGDRRSYNPQSAPSKLKNLVSEIIKRQPNAQIMVASLPKIREKSFKGEEFYQAINQMAADLGNKSDTDNIYFVDINAVNFNLDQDLDPKDGLHHLDGAARQTAVKWLEALKPHLIAVQN